MAKWKPEDCVVRPTRREFLTATAAAGVAFAAAPSLFAAAPDGTQAARAAGDASAGTGDALADTSGGFTRGVGVYPGQPRSFVGPRLVAAPVETRNLALLKPAYHSSSYDYNLTAQCVTDGITATDLPTWFACTVNDRLLPRPEREILLDHHPANTLKMNGTHRVVELAIGGRNGDARSRSC